MKNKKSIVCFTASYPYGTRETYFETELAYLAKKFDEVYIIPLYNPYGNKNVRVTPSNVYVKEVILPNGLDRVLYGLFNWIGFGNFFSEFVHQKVYRSKLRLKKWFNSLLIYRISTKQFKKIKQNIPKNAILYSYWAEMPLFSSNVCLEYIKVVRMHGADFYLERNDGYLPLRKLIYESANYVLPISKDIYSVLRDSYGINIDKIRLSYLGVKNKQNYCTVYHGKILKVVSCSHVYPLKRVHLILDALNKVKSSIQIEWHHIGSGTSFSWLENYASKNTNQNIQIKFHGQMSQGQLLEFYENNYFHWFVNVSTHEGLPVSIMECFSFGIPAIATDVGGTHEIIDDKNGFLLDKNFDSKELARLLEEYTSEDYLKKRQHAYQTWRVKFNADKNYTQLTSFFCGMFSDLHIGLGYKEI